MDMQSSQRRELEDKEKEATKLRTENMRVTRDGKMQQRHAEEVQVRGGNNVIATHIQNCRLERIYFVHCDA